MGLKSGMVAFTRTIQLLLKDVGDVRWRGDNSQPEDAWRCLRQDHAVESL